MKTTSSNKAPSPLDPKAGELQRSMAFSVATEIRPLADEELDQVAGAIESNYTGCTASNSHGTVCYEWKI